MVWLKNEALHAFIYREYREKPLKMNLTYNFQRFIRNNTSDSQNDLSVSKLFQIRANTDRMINLIKFNLSFATNEGNFSSKEEFKIILDNVRSLVDNKKITICDQVMT